MKKQIAWKLAVALLPLVGVAAWVNSSPRSDPGLIGHWVAMPDDQGMLETDHFLLNRDGTWSEPEGWATQVPDSKCWWVSRDEVYLRSRIALWGYRGSLMENYSYSCFWLARAWQSGKWPPNTHVSRYRRVIGEGGEVSLISIPDDPKQGSHQLVRLQGASGGAE